MSKKEADHPKAYHVASLDGLVKAATGTAVTTGAVALAVALFTDLTAFAVFLALICLVAIVGSAFFGGLRRTARATSAMVGEHVLAQGVGRGGRGFLGAHAVAVTDSSILSVSARPWGVGRPGPAIRLSEINSMESGTDFLKVTGSRTEINLKKASPLEVEALLDTLRRRAPSGVDRVSP